MYGEQPEPGFFESIFNLVGSMNFWLVILGIFILFSSIVITSGKRAMIIEQFGKPLLKARLPGLSFKLPWPIQSVVGEVNLQLQNAKANVSVKTKDNAFMDLPVDVQYRVINDAESAVRAHYELEKPEEQIVNYVLNNVKNTAGGLDMQELYSNRDDIETSAQTALSNQFRQYGYEIVNVLVDEPMPSDEVRDSFNRVIASKREKEAAQNVADARRIELVGIATAEKESKKLQGEGMSNMREAIASGMKTAMKTLTDSGLTVEQALGLMMDTNRLDTIATASANGNLVLVDMESSSDMAKTIGAVQAAGKTGPRAVADAA
jgi:regulator of protease activity HflC (stomatin/prohibitin superfamily)